MIIVTGSVHAKPDRLAEVLALSVEHVHRSRSEPGCRLHTVHQDVEDPLRVVFLEHWEDREALSTHFALPATLRQIEADIDQLDAGGTSEFATGREFLVEGDQSDASLVVHVIEELFQHLGHAELAVDALGPGRRA